MGYFSETDLILSGNYQWSFFLDIKVPCLYIQFIPNRILISIKIGHCIRVNNNAAKE